MSKNEKQTDLIVAQKLKDVGIKFSPNGSTIVDIKKALKSASKKGNGKNGYPEYVAQVGDFLIVIEDKADSAHQAKYIDESKTSLLMDSTSIMPKMGQCTTQSILSNSLRSKRLSLLAVLVKTSRIFTFVQFLFHQREQSFFRD